ncbi:phosphatase PAP2 family protein [Sphingorhabdus lutea]|uniref:Phosphatase PAP2 family protein n=2 Tax=Sphingorhabdus lutea TaxID=1913578 RepID=A0A1L3JFD1_9SPHN|nr:phosphatase PAP2 family protein [Sphingorhabdus lutea]
MTGAVMRGGVVILFACAMAVPAYASEKTWDDAGTIAKNGLVAAALILPAAKKDLNGGLQSLGSMGVAYIITQTGKDSFPKLRPDGSDYRSFPSGHTSMAFSAAATMHNRYGWKVGLPAQAVAAFVGVSRIKAKKHDWADVLTGMAIGQASGFLITNKRNENVVIIPFGDTKGGGVAALVRF